MPLCQSEAACPKALVKSELSRTDHAGRGAGVGYSALDIAVTCSWHGQPNIRGCGENPLCELKPGHGAVPGIVVQTPATGAMFNRFEDRQ